MIAAKMIRTASIATTLHMSDTIYIKYYNKYSLCPYSSLQAYVAFSRFDKILGRFLAPMSKRI